MNDKPKNPLSDFDDFLQNSPFQMMKLMLPFLPAANQKTLIILLKFMELKYTLDYFRKGHKLDICAMADESASPMDKIAAMKDYLPPKEQESIETMMNMMSAMELFQGMSEDGGFPFPFPMNMDENEEVNENSEEKSENSNSPSSPVSSQSLEPSENSEPLTETKPSEPEKPKTISICSNIDF